MERHEMMGRILYGVVFCVVIPALLYLIMQRLDALALFQGALPFSANIGCLILLSGLGLMAWSMLLLIRKGDGLPMNAYPTRKLVRSGPYSVVKNPIYAGFVIAVAGFALAIESPGGFWFVTPVTALCCVALWVGYERLATKVRLDTSGYTPFLSLPDDNDSNLTWAEKLSAALQSIGAWAAIYGLLSVLVLEPNRLDLRTKWDYSGPVDPSWLILYSSIYFAAGALPFIASKRSTLRRFVVSVWAGIFVGFGLLLLLPFKASYIDATMSETTTLLLNWNRSLDSEWMAFPAFHAFWAVLTALFVANQSKKWGLFVSLYALAVCVSCSFSGQHAILDIVAGAMLAGLAGTLVFLPRDFFHFLSRCRMPGPAEPLARSGSWRAVI